MIIRVVKMNFLPEHVPAFLSLFEDRKELIRHFEGCNHLELWQDAQESNVFFTYSRWDSEAHLNKYRFSELFKNTWTQTKALFLEKAAAWSVEQKIVVN